MPPFSDIMFHTRPRMLKDFLQDDTNSHNRNLVKFKPSKSAFQAMVNALRSLSRRLSSNYKRGLDGDGEMKVITVRVKDIIRWKSFRDLVEEKCPALTDSTTTSGCCSSEGWSWCDGDFSCGEEEYGKNDVGRDYLETTTETEWVEPEDEDVGSEEEEEEQHSPLSVLDLQLKDDEFEKEISSVCEWGHNKEVCVREMERGGMWSKFEEDQQEVCLEIEIGLFGSMIDELLGDL